MERERLMEIGVGLFVAAGLAALLVLALKISNLASLSGNQGYELIARFDNVGGLKVRSPVTAAGVRVGRVAAIDYDRKTFEAVVRLRIDPAFAHTFPKDTSARIFTAGLLGEQYIALEPGGDEAMLEDGDEIRLTQSALVLEQVIGQFLYNAAGKKSEQP